MKFKFTLFFCSLLCTGCGTPEHPKSMPLTDIYNQVHQQGARDAVTLLREGMRSNHMWGASDPYIPLRKPDEIIPIWVPSRRDRKTGRLVHGHWEQSVIRWSDWYTQ